MSGISYWKRSESEKKNTETLAKISVYSRGNVVGKGKIEVSKILQKEIHARYFRKYLKMSKVMYFFRKQMHIFFHFNKNGRLWDV